MGHTTHRMLRKCMQRCAARDVVESDRALAVPAPDKSVEARALSPGDAQSVALATYYSRIRFAFVSLVRLHHN